MRCRCGNEIKHVPQHLRDLATWVCQQCTNAAPRTGSLGLIAEEPTRKSIVHPRKKTAA